jgi:hypothetical protein
MAGERAALYQCLHCVRPALTFARAPSRFIAPAQRERGHGEPSRACYELLKRVGVSRSHEGKLTEAVVPERPLG